jgi:hypothetical protein
MKSLLLTLSILILSTLNPSYSYGAGCQGKVVNTTLNSLSWTNPTINLNSTLRIFTGNHPATVADVFTTSGRAFTGFNTSIEQVDDKDLRNSLMRLIFPRDLKPSEYYILFSLTDSGMEEVKSKKNAAITLSLRVNNQTKNVNFNVSSDPAWNCN